MTELVVVALGVLAASAVQTVSGFGFALLAMPIMTTVLPVERAVVIGTLLGTLSSGWLAVRLRHDVVQSVARRTCVAAYFGMPLGLFVLVTVDDRVLRLALGASVLVATLLIIRRIDLAHVGPGLDVGAGFVSGVLNTSLSTNGPPLVFAMQARQLSPERFRATISMVFLVSNVGGLGLFAAAGKFTVDGVVGAAVALPAWLMGAALGVPIRRHVHGERFRWLVIGLLALAGSATIVLAV